MVRVFGGGFFFLGSLEDIVIGMVRFVFGLLRILIIGLIFFVIGFRVFLLILIGIKFDK